MRGVSCSHNQTPLERGFDEIKKLLENKLVAKSVVEGTKEMH